jgi:hypothetical protein
MFASLVVNGETAAKLLEAMHLHPLYLHAAGVAVSG